MSNHKFQELNLSDDFLFPAALEDPITCRLVLECIIEEKIEELQVKVEYTKKYNSEFKYIRLDVYAKDSVSKLSYNLEMQNKDEHNLPLRSRYYQAQIDIGNLKPGEDYKNLKPVYVIFICNFDPLDQKLYRYTFSMQCEERSFMLHDGAKRIFLSTKGKNEREVPQLLLDFLGYLNDSTDEYVEHNSNEKIKEIHGRIKELKKNRDVEARYMHYLCVDKLIEEKEKQLKQKDTELQQKDTQLQQKDTRLQQKDTQLQQKDTQLQQKDTELQQKDTELQQKDTELQQKDTELQQKDTELQQKDTELQQKDQEIKAIIRDMVFEAVKALGNLSENAYGRIKKEADINTLKAMHKISLKSGSVEQFENQIANL